jgi:uncharacterized integral membrane protein
MRFVYLSLIVLITLAVITFKIQNIDSVTVSFLARSMTLSTSTLILIVYFLGMLTGSSLPAQARFQLEETEQTQNQGGGGNKVEGAG